MYTYYREILSISYQFSHPGPPHVAHRAHGPGHRPAAPRRAGSGAAHAAGLRGWRRGGVDAQRGADAGEIWGKWGYLNGIYIYIYMCVHSISICILIIFFKKYIYKCMYRCSILSIEHCSKPLLVEDYGDDNKPTEESRKENNRYNGTRKGF